MHWMLLVKQTHYGLTSSPTVLTYMGRTCIRVLPCWDAIRVFPMSTHFFLSSFCWEIFETMSISIIVGSETLGDSSGRFIKIQGTNWAVLNSYRLSYIFWASDLNSQIFYFYKKELLFAGQDLLYVNPCCLFALLNCKCPFPPKPMERYPLVPNPQICWFEGR